MYILINLLFFILNSSLPGKTTAGKLAVIIHNKVGRQTLELKDKWYINPSGEKYSVDLFKYYVSNIKMVGGSQFDEPDSYHLINAASPSTETIIINLPPGKYDGVSFMIGVDSIHNVSGAQDGDLDPLKGMFWAWNSGYIMAKFEGHSDASAFNHKFEYHIGGFEGADNVVKNVHLPVKFEITEASTATINIVADINKWWGNNKLSINKIPTIATPGHVAKMISNNYGAMFSIE